MTARRLHIAMIIQAYLPHIGGAERQLAALAPLLAEQGVAISVITRRYPGMSQYEVIDGVPVYRLPVPGPKAIASLSFTLSALRLLRRLQPDLIHAHELLSPTTTAAAAKRWLGIPVVAKVLRGGVLGDLAKLQGRWGGPRRMATFKRVVDGFIVISQEIDQELAQWGVAAAKRFFIPNGVDTRRFQPVDPDTKAARHQQFGLTAGPTALYTGRFVAEKCLDQLVALWPQVRAVFPQAHLLLAGTGPEEATLRQMAGEGVTFLGQVDDVLPLLQLADLFVLPSATEGLSNAMLEALAVGLPVIATAVGGAPDVIKHGESGWLVRPRQPTELHDALISLFSEEALRVSLGQAGRQKVINEYSLNVTAERLVALYEQLVSISAASRWPLADKLTS